MKIELKSLIIGLFTLSALSTSAQENEQWKRMLQMEGAWAGPATLILDGKTYNLNYQVNFKIDLDGAGMTMYETFTHAELGIFKGLNLIGLNAADGMIHWSSIDNFGTAHEHIGSWSSANSFTMIHEGKKDGKVFKEDIKINLKNSNTSEIELVATHGGAAAETIKGKFTRQNKSGKNASGMNQTGGN